MKTLISYFWLVMIFIFILIPSDAFAETVEILIVKSSFVPAVVKIKTGDIVRWTNTEELLHTITSGKAPQHDKKFNENYLYQKFEITMNEPGFYDYFCVLHNATMRGVIIVEENKSAKLLN
jgi:plastocyanin